MSLQFRPTGFGQSAFIIEPATAAVPEMFYGIVATNEGGNDIYLRIHVPSEDTLPKGDADLHEVKMQRSASKALDTKAIKDLVLFYTTAWALDRATEV